MRRVFGLAWLMMLSASTITYALAADEISATKTYELDEETIDKELLRDNNQQEVHPALNTTEKPKIITEEIPNGRIEKLLDNENRVIAEKKIEGDKITQKTLNYYYPTGRLMRRITSMENNQGFQAREFYQNGKIGSEAIYLNEDNKIGTEKRYDTQGILRQEVPWVLPNDEDIKNQKPIQTIRKGEITTYYPNGRKAAVFSVGKAGKNIFYNQQGEIIKEINDTQILKFTQELTDEECQGKTIHLDLQSLVELYEDEGDISYNRCGMPYRENFVYEVLDKTPGKEQMISYDETGMIRRITPYTNGVKHGVEQKFDANGNLTAEINYQQGKKQGLAKGYFPTREVAFQKQYNEGKAEGKLICYFPTGEVAAEFNYVNGVKEGTAEINSPIKKQLQFSQGKLLNVPDNDEHSQQISALTRLNKTVGKCLQIDEKLTEIEKDIDENASKIEQTLMIHQPKECEDINTFETENDKLICKNAQGQKIAEIPLSYKQDGNATEKVYDPSGNLQYSIPFVNKKKQGWVKAYNKEGIVEADIYFKQDQRAGSSRSYYTDGKVKEMLVYAEDTPRKVLVHYNKDGKVIFSLTVKEDERQEAYINNQTNGKDVTVRYYDNKMDTIRESTIQMPYDYTEYNLALREYAIYRNNELVSGGPICDLTPKEENSLTVTEEKQNNKQVQSTESTSENTPLISEKDIEEMIGKSEVLPADKKEDTEAKIENTATANNIEPVSKPNVETAIPTIQQEIYTTDKKRVEEDLEPKTDKFYYPNGNLRKTVKTKGSRTEEVKEYSKSGLLLTDTQYKRDKIIIEKYSGSGVIRRKTEKNYDDNAVNAFEKREDFYDNGNPRYMVERRPQTMLFSEKTYDEEGKLKTETVQTGPLTFKIKEYGKDGNQTKEMTLPESKDIITENDRQIIRTYNAKGKVQTEVTWYNSGEISVKGYNQDGSLAKLAYLSASDGKLHIEKPELRSIPAYRERHWVDYNNPRWVENQDKYSVKSIARLNIDIVNKIFAELKMSELQKIKTLKEKY